MIKSGNYESVQVFIGEPHHTVAADRSGNRLFNKASPNDETNSGRRPLTSTSMEAAKKTEISLAKTLSWTIRYQLCVMDGISLYLIKIIAPDITSLRLVCSLPSGER